MKPSKHNLETTLDGIHVLTVRNLAEIRVWLGKLDRWVNVVQAMNQVPDGDMAEMPHRRPSPSRAERPADRLHEQALAQLIILRSGNARNG